MFIFGFNSCIPQDYHNEVYVKFLADTFLHFKCIKDSFPNEIDGIITHLYPSDYILNNNKITLADCIEYLNREIRILAYTYFNKFPIESFYHIVDEDSLLSNKYSIVVDNTGYDATREKIVYDNTGILFTLALHPDLRIDNLTIHENSQNDYSVLNLFGDDANTKYLLTVIEKEIFNKLDNFNKFTELIGKCKYSSKFKKDFEALTYETQIRLLSRIVEAKNRKLVTNFASDNNLIKDVTPTKENQIRLFELRLFNPVAIRLYFFETKEMVFLASIKKKPQTRVQDNDISNSLSIIKEMISISN